MSDGILDGFSLIDPLGRLILTTTLLTLLGAIIANLFVRARYRRLQRDLEHSTERFSSDLLNGIVDDAWAAARRHDAVNTQAIIEDHFQTRLKGPLVAERFVKAATGLVIILGLLGTFYGLTLSIGRIVRLVAADAGGAADVAGAVTSGLTHALSGMAVAFSNSLVGIVSAVILTVLGVLSNLTDRRVALMLQLETSLDRLLSEHVASAPSANGPPARTASGLSEAVLRLEAVIARFEAGLARFAGSSTEFHEFNVHLKDNIQRMSLNFGDFSDVLRGQIVELKARDGR